MIYCWALQKCSSYHVIIIDVLCYFKALLWYFKAVTVLRFLLEQVKINKENYKMYSRSVK